MSIFISFVILAIASQSYAGLSKKLCPFTKCSYTGDPHLTPFPATYNGPQNQYMCSNVGWDLVVANPFIQVYAFVGPAPYWILDYVLIFPGHGAYSTCVAVGGIPGAQLCGASSAVNSFQTSSSTWVHFHKYKCIAVEIEQYSSFYNIYIYQTPSLNNISRGICIEPDCECKPEQKWIKPLPVIPRVCDVFIGAAQKRAMGEIDPNVVDMARDSCVNDMQMTFDARVGQTALSRVLYDSADSQLANQDFAAVFEKAEAIKSEALLEATKQANEVIKGSGDGACNDQKQCLSPIIDSTRTLFAAAAAVDAKPAK